MSELTVKLNDTVEVTVSNTLRTSFARAAFAARMPDFGELQAGAQGVVDIFLSIAAATKSVKGLEWKPPAFMASSDELANNLEQLLMLVDVDTLVTWNKAITAASKINPVPDEQEQPNENPMQAAVLESES